MNMNDLLQGAAVVVLLVICAVWIVGRVRRKFHGVDCDDATGCEGCSLLDHCRKRKHN
ncbi:MAG: hypothetical protein NC338_08315 [Firmicutes bacterium]|nr:hypothetical protein [Bacillota bacterium]MCM1402005.1 hypothetical protein [Bacteroides sp.]MCM1476890.1 hypothetical protein [Bacteroides sp.]